MDPSFIHPTAIVDLPAHIGGGTHIWHFSHIMKNAVIGEQCNLGQNVFVASGVKIGSHCKIQNNVSLYEGVVLEDHVFCGPSMVFTNVKHPRCEIVRRGEYEQTYVEHGATLGANCTIVCGTRIGRYAFIAAGAVVAGDVPPFALMAGVPARRIGWSGRLGYRLEPVNGQPGHYTCPGDGALYIQKDERTLMPMDDASNKAGESIQIQETPPVPLLDLKRQFASIECEMKAAIMRVVEAQAFILGPEVKAFEEEAALAIGTPHAIGCASGTDALLLALMALDLEPGDEIITTPYTFFATAGSIVRLGLKPVFCDIDPATFNLDVTRLAGLVTSRTRAIMPVHLFGQCAPMDPILDLAKKHELAVIEDAAQAIGARDGGRGAGTMGTIGCFSFFPSKNLGGFGDGGLMTTADPELAKKLKSLRVHGSAERYFHEWVGINSRLDAIQAAVLRVKLPHLEGWSDLRAAHAAEYGRLFRKAGLVQGEGWAPNKGLVVLPQVTQKRHVFNQYVIRVHEELREELRRYLGEKKIGTAVYYPLALHLQPCFASLGYHEGDLPMAEAASHETLALPVFPELTLAEQQRVVEAIGNFLKDRD